MKSISLRILVVSLVAMFAVSAYPQCTTPFASQPSPPSGDVVLIDDALPSGATVTSGTVNWDTSQYATGTQSFYLSGAGTNTLVIEDLDQYLTFGSGKVVFYALIDPCSPTSEIKLSYSSAHRNASVYWGSNLISGPYVNFNRGALPSTGVWTRFEVGIHLPLGLQGHTLETLVIETSGGRVWFDHLGTDGAGCVPSVASSVSLETGDTIWVDDTVPGYATLAYGYFDDEQAAQGSLSLMYPYFAQTATSIVRVDDLNESTVSGDNLILYVMPTSCKELKELKITWYSGSTEGAIYYGTVGFPAIGGEGSAVNMGTTLPTNDTWNRIEIPATLVGLDGLTITRVKVENIGGKVWVDAIGKQTP